MTEDRKNVERDPLWTQHTPDMNQNFQNEHDILTCLEHVQLLFHSAIPKITFIFIIACKDESFTMRTGTCIKYVDFTQYG